jgi:hypothetical protein
MAPPTRWRVPTDIYMVGWQADSISSGHTKNQGATLIPDPGSKPLTGLSCQSNGVECQDSKSLKH